MSLNKGRISTNEIARICGVSQGTVDRALNNRKGISQKTKERILKVAKEYGYRPNIHASSMAGGKSHLIGVVVFDLNNPYFADILMNVETYIRNQLEEDNASDQISFKEYTDPFTGAKNK